MRNNLNRAVSLTQILIPLPKAEIFLSFILLTGILFGIISTLATDQTYEKILEGILKGIYTLSIPTLLTTILVKLFLRSVPFRRIIALSFIAQLIYAIAYLLYIFSENFQLENREIILFLAGSISFVMWFLVAKLVFIQKWKSFIFATLQLIFYSVFLFTGNIFSLSSPIEIIFKFFIASIILLAFIYFFFLIINAPMKRNLNLNTIDAISLFFAHWFNESKEIEEEFEKIGEEVETYLTAFIFKRDNDKIAFVIPYVHFGPFGSLGGSDFPYLIEKELNEKFSLKTFVFHAPVTHDLNPVASSELDKIISAFSDEYLNAKYEKSKVAFSKAQSGECFSHVLIFKNSAFISLSRAPYTTEDINFGLGLAFIEAGKKYFDIVAIVDQHNSETGEITSFEPGSDVGFKYLAAIHQALKNNYSFSNLKIGVFSKQLNLSSLGKGGLKIAVFSSEPYYVLILLDANGVTPELRENIISNSLKVTSELGIKAEIGVYTTDTHSVNVVKGVLNPLREKNEVLKEIEIGIKEAFKDMREATLYSFSRKIKINVLGAKQSIEIVSTINAIVAVAKIVAPIIFIGSIISLIWLLSKI